MAKNKKGRRGDSKPSSSQQKTDRKEQQKNRNQRKEHGATQDHHEEAEEQLNASSSSQSKREEVQLSDNRSSLQSKGHRQEEGKKEEEEKEESDKSSSSSSSPSFNSSLDDQPDLTSSDYYFDSYAHFGIHEEMLKDEVRTRSYMNAIERNRHLFQGRTVLDVGCGTGILSMFCARAGAAQVIGIECSSIIEQARQIVEDNGLSEAITLIHGKVEEVDIPVEKVDIIVSEWMGYFLLYESMLDTVIFARDKWLAEGGLVFPDKAVLYMAAIQDEVSKQEKLTWWQDVYGFDMSCIGSLVAQEPLVDTIDQSALCSNAVPILRLDLLSCTKEDLTFSSSFSLQMIRNDFIHGFVGYFECAFSQLHKPIYFSTGPHAPYTHWKQTMFFLDDAVTACAGEMLNCRIQVRPNEKNQRDLDIIMDYALDGRCHQVQKRQFYRLR